MRVPGNLLRFRALEVGEEHETVVTVAFEENGADRCLARRRRGGETHRIWIDQVRRDGIVEPGLELPDGIGRKIVFFQLAATVVASQVGDVHFGATYPRRARTVRPGRRTL